jgi:hypothetical protein
MSNMSYCRFQNTLKDLMDCQNALEEFFTGADDSDLSADELRAAHQLVETCLSIAQLVGDQRSIDIDADDALNQSTITDIFDDINDLRSEGGQEESDDE